MFEDSGTCPNTSPILDSGADHCVFYVSPDYYHNLRLKVKNPSQVRTASGKMINMLRLVSTPKKPLTVRINDMEEAVPVQYVFIAKAGYQCNGGVYRQPYQGKVQALIGRGTSVMMEPYNTIRI